MRYLSNKQWFWGLLLPLLLCFSRTPTLALDFDVDVLVYGGTSAGVIAAYTATHYGKSVLLVEPGRHLGGMSSGGLGQTDIGNKYAITGLARDFYRRLGRYYGQFEAWQFEPHVAEQAFEAYVDEAEVEVLFSRRLKSVEKSGTTIRQVTLAYAGKGAASPELVVRARFYIDATYEGDLMARAGASYMVGREANSVYGETYNGAQFPAINHQFPNGREPVVVMDGTPELGPPVDPYSVPGEPASGLLPEITGVGVAASGTGDKKVQAYNFRMSLCQDKDNRLPIPSPTHYDADRYALLLRDMASNPPKSLHDLFIISQMPNGKTDWNNKGAFSTDYIGKNWDYAEADDGCCAEIWQDLLDYQQGLIYFLAHDERVPVHLRKEMQQWGFCRGEFLDTGGWPHQLYVREARRLIGETVMTEHHCLGREVVEDGIGLAAYGMDSHNVQRVVVDGIVLNEGNVQVDVPAPYPIAYRAITPKRKEVTNLVVPVALSASHIAYGSIRMEPVFMVLGQSAAVAVSMALDADIAVQQVDVSALQQELRTNPLADGSPPEVLIDDRDTDQVQLTGHWVEVRADRGGYGPSYRHDDNRNKGQSSLRFMPHFRHAGRYDVYLYWPRMEDRAATVPVAIKHDVGTERLAVDMQAGGNTWLHLGAFAFSPENEAYIEVKNKGTDGYVLADAVLFVPHASL